MDSQFSQAVVCPYWIALHLVFPDPVPPVALCVPVVKPHCGLCGHVPVTAVF